MVRDAVLDFVVELMSLPSGLTANGLQVRSAHWQHSAARALHTRPQHDAHSCCGCVAACCRLQVLLFNLLPSPGSPLLPPETPGAPWEVPPQAAEVQDAVIAAIEQVCGVFVAQSAGLSASSGRTHSS